MKNAELWPALDYENFKSTAYLLHRVTQLMGKLKLYTPFEPHWGNVPLWLTSEGLTTGLIPYQDSAFSIDLNMFDHSIMVKTTSGEKQHCTLKTMSVAQLTKTFLMMLDKLNIQLKINLMPQEIPNPIPFDKDNKENFYNKELAHDWWKILINIYKVMQSYHSRFDGESPPVGFMWGTFDLRDARYNGIAVPTTGITDYIRRNAMDEAQIEMGWWSGNELYPKPAFYSFAYPEPPGISQAKIKPEKAYWHPELKEFVLDYEVIKQSSHPEKDLLDFFETTYEVASTLAKWDKKFITKGKPR